MSEFDLHPERLGTTDENGRRIFPQPADVIGRYRTRRTWVQAVLIMFFLALPWLRIAGRQAVLLDITNRHFEIFGLTLRAHNAPLLVFVFAAFFFGLFFVTAVWGRVWCGWACPQTVFIDGVFRRIERLVEGSAAHRRELDKAHWTFTKVRLRFVKWSLFAFVCLVISHSFMAYFIGTESLESMMTHPPLENWANFVLMAATTAILLFNFGWFREQFCVIACPYGRFQSVLMDSRSLIIGYDVKRGEPRATIEAKRVAKAEGTSLGDCVNCYRCVQVCPVGIDIRRGVQMECIACTACVDACDDMMTKIKKPTGLIRYDSMLALDGDKQRKFSLRAAAYAFVAVGSVVALFISLDSIKPVEVTFLRAKESPYQIVDPTGDASITNHFILEISNESENAHTLIFATKDSQVQIVTAFTPLPVPADEMVRASLFVKFPKSILKSGQRIISIRIIDTDSKTHEQTEFEKEVAVVGPFS
jgi:cytochrome c oxidase accessory protein FixG